MAFAILRNTLDLENIKFNSIFVVRTDAYLASKDISNCLYEKAGFLVTDFLRKVGTVRKTSQRSSVFCCIHIFNFILLMRTVDKNLNQLAKGMRGSTPNTRKSVQCVKSYTIPNRPTVACIYMIDLEYLKKFPIFVMPNLYKVAKSLDFTASRINKAGFFSTHLLFADFVQVWRLRESLASFCINVPQIFRFEMPNLTKNLNQQAKGMRGSTPNTRKSVQCVRSYTIPNRPLAACFYMIDLEVLKKFPIFVVPNQYRAAKSLDFIASRLNKAGFFSTHLLFADFVLVWRLRESLAYFYINVPQIFRFEMPNQTKNLNQQAKGMRGSTPNTRKSVQCVKSYTLKINQLTKELNQLKQDFEIEKHAKNEAYSFILAQGILDRFKAYRPSELNTLQERLKLLTKSISVK